MTAVSRVAAVARGARRARHPPLLQPVGERLLTPALRASAAITVSTDASRCHQGTVTGSGGYAGLHARPAACRHSPSLLPRAAGASSAPCLPTSSLHVLGHLSNPLRLRLSLPLPAESRPPRSRHAPQASSPSATLLPSPASPSSSSLPSMSLSPSATSAPPPPAGGACSPPSPAASSSSPASASARAW